MQWRCEMRWVTQVWVTWHHRRLPPCPCGSSRYWEDTPVLREEPCTSDTSQLQTVTVWAGADRGSLWVSPDSMGGDGEGKGREGRGNRKGDPLLGVCCSSWCWKKAANIGAQLRASELMVVHKSTDNVLNPATINVLLHTFKCPGYVKQYIQRKHQFLDVN